MKKIIFFLSIIFLAASCNSGSRNDNQGNNVSIQATTLPDFNVNNFAELVKKTKNPTDIETAINAPDNDINNLDLDKNGKVDFLKVVESQNQIQVLDDVDDKNSVTVATLTITKNNDMADMQIQGNPSYCGPDYRYHSSFSLGEVLLLSYLLTPHRYYVPMYHYGYYPSYYRSYSTTTYRTVTRSSSNNRGSNGSLRSGNSRSSVGSPIRSQRSFSARDNSAPVRSGGFGNRSSSSNSSFGSGRSSFGSGRSSFGSGRSSFGRRR